jgi:uncharacterized protein YkwD
VNSRMLNKVADFLKTHRFRASHGAHRSTALCKHSLLVSLAFVAATLSASAWSAAQEKPATPAERPADAMVLYQRLNYARSKHGESLLAFDRRLVAVARRQALDMVARHYFAHVAPDGRSPFDRFREAGIEFGYAGENLAINAGPDAAYLALWRSIPHRRNMLEPHYRRVGIAAVNRPEGEEIFVEEFSD